MKTLTLYRTNHQVLFNHTEVDNTWAKTIANAKKAGIIDLSHVQLSNCDLTDVDFSGMNLQHALLNGTILHQTSFEGADLSHANMRYVKAGCVNFKKAQLVGTVLITDLQSPEAPITQSLDFADANTEELTLLTRTIWE